jgi:thymidylate synthase (FAD)
LRLIRESVNLFTLLGDLDISHQERIAEYIELCGRQCYQSTHKIGPGSSIKFVKNLISSGHHSVLEHINISARIVTNRAISLEIVRHRLNSFSQESTRYCNYSGDRFGNELTYIIPVWISDEKITKFDNIDHGYIVPNEILDDVDYAWYDSLRYFEETYFELLDKGWTPEKAREILPNSLKTELVMTANIRQWRHVLLQRLSPKCHLQMRYLMSIIGEKFLESLPLFFEDIISSKDFVKIGQ